MLWLEPVVPQDFRLALELQRSPGLLTNDSLNVAVAKRLNIVHLATADRGLADVPDMTIYVPDDLPAGP